VDPENRVRAGSKDDHIAYQALLALHFEANPGPDTLADPAPLDFLQRFAEFYFFQSLKESFGIFGDTQAPLAHPTLYYGVATAIAYAVYRFIVGEDSAKRLAPVDVGIPQVGKSVL